MFQQLHKYTNIRPHMALIFDFKKPVRYAFYWCAQ